MGQCLCPSAHSSSLSPHEPGQIAQPTLQICFLHQKGFTARPQSHLLWEALRVSLLLSQSKVTVHLAHFFLILAVLLRGKIVSVDNENSVLCGHLAQY